MEFYTLEKAIFHFDKVVLYLNIAEVTFYSKYKKVDITFSNFPYVRLYVGVDKI